MTEGYIAPKKAKAKAPVKKAPKIRHWAQATVLNRLVADKLNELSAAGYTIFTVNQSVSIGGSYATWHHVGRFAGYCTCHDRLYRLWGLTLLCRCPQSGRIRWQLLQRHRVGNDSRDDQQCWIRHPRWNDHHCQWLWCNLLSDGGTRHYKRSRSCHSARIRPLG